MLNSRTILAVILILFTLLSCNKNHKAFKSHINSVSQDSLVVLNENGLLESIDAQSVKTPQFWGVEFRIIYLIQEGRFVAPGDTLVRFDPTPILNELDEDKATLDISEQEYMEIRENNALSLREKLNTIESLRMQYTIDSAKVAQAVFESEVTRQELKLELEKTKLELARAYKNLEAQKIINKTSERLKLIKIQRAKISMQRTLRRLKEMNLIAGQAGIVVYSKMRKKGQELREGETVFPGQKILEIANLSRMKATLFINEVDRELIKCGQYVRLVVNAYPDTLFEGRVENIAKIAGLLDDGKTVKGYDTDVYLNPGKNYRLKPGLSVRAEIAIDTLRKVFKIPRWCLKNKRGRWMVQNTKGKEFWVNPVRLNDGFVFVRGNLIPGMALKAE